jgi:hypothetical protein
MFELSKQLSEEGNFYEVIKYLRDKIANIVSNKVQNFGNT